MRHDESKPITIIIAILTVLLILVLLVGCKTKTVYVPVEKTKIEYKDKIKIDSLIRYDSIFQDRYMKGDTVFQIKEKYKYIDKIKIVRDSVFKIDSIQVPYPVKGDTIEVNRLKWYQEACIWFTSLVLFALFAFLGIKYRSIIFSIIKKMFFHS
ncbi:hypothetical protein JGH11_16065 [Dysgonomonas sp. Marseille-P4677]|uniref:hypothetical protein n=1 Tax=Dysgonomonas sp. Marseille-P4677 TaxID=2364790 RepID=UPI00191192F2|nr:hypothetical protein [Dysgonomonas sp. Marseille-P4677]MBK5722392.1 hypothetical protein [Dysgonomonas sp. Marseille-P4677]